MRASQQGIQLTRTWRRRSGRDFGRGAGFRGVLRPLGRALLRVSSDQSAHRSRRITMLSWAITFLIIALIAGVLGFAGIMGTAAWIAKVLFVVFLVLFLVSLLTGRRINV